MFAIRVPQRLGSNPHRQRHVHAQEHELLVVEDGHGHQLLPAGELPCAPGEVFVFPAGEPHLSWCAPGEAFTVLVLNARPIELEPELRNLLQQVAAGGSRQLDCSAATRGALRRLLARSADEQRSALPGSACAAHALAVEALVTLARDPLFARATKGPCRDPGAAARHVAEARAWLANHFMLPVRLDDLLALGPLSRSAFMARFRALAGRSPGEELIALRLEEACRRLAAGRGSLVEIALGCGFGSQSHFNHLFRRTQGMSPGAWRRHSR